MRVCIVGSGVAGLQCADIMTKYGHICHIFEKSDGPGGVWRKNYDGYSLQVPSELYEFVKMPSEQVDQSFPSGQKVQEYIEKYITENKLFETCHFHFCEEVVEADYDDSQWHVKTHLNDAAESQSYRFDFCVIATGMYNKPHIPNEFMPYNPIHTSSFTDASQVANKNVVVVCGGKSAIDCAVAASKYANKVTIVSREMHWPVPRYILGLIPFKWGTYSRLGHFLLPQHWDINDKEKRWHELLRPVKYFVWRMLEDIFAFQFGLSTRPRTPLEVDLFNGGQILTYEFKNAMKEKKIECARISDTLLKEADVVVVGTGFSKTYEIFTQNIRNSLEIEYDGLWLYRNIIPIDVERLAFIGSEVSTFNNILTHYLQSQWLTHYLENVSLLDNDTMRLRLEKERTWKRSWMPNTTSRASLIQLHMTKYHDTLLSDFNLPLRKYKWWQWFIPLTARDY